MTGDRDFLDEIVQPRVVRNPAFAGMVATAYERRVALRAGSEAPDEPAGREGPHRAEAVEQWDTQRALRQLVTGAYSVCERMPT